MIIQQLNSNHLISTPKLKAKAKSTANQNYASIVTLSTRQTFGGLDLTIPGDTMDINDFMVFMKEISSDGNVNTMVSKFLNAKAGLFYFNC